MSTRALLMAGVVVLVSCRPAPEQRIGESASRGSPPVSAAPARRPGAPAPGPEAAAPEGCTPVWPAQVRLSGVLRAEERPGPPGYGETPEQDRRLTIYVLELERPRDVCADPNPDQPREAAGGVTHVQLSRVDPDRLQARVGRHVHVTGTLHHRVWASDFTEVIVWVDRIADASSTPLSAA